MSRVKRKWREGDKPVSLRFLYGPLGMVEAMFRCPGCGQHVEVDYGGEELFYHCRCGARLRLTFEPTLEELEEEEVKGERGKDKNTSQHVAEAQGGFGTASPG